MALNYLTDADVDTLRQMREWISAQRNKPNPKPADALSQLGVSFLTKVPTLGIPARSGNAPGVTKCDIYRLIPNTISALDGAYTITEQEDLEVRVFNVYKYPCYKDAQDYIRVTRDAFGHYLCEAPRRYHKATAVATIAVGTFGTVKLVFNGSTTNNTLSAHLNWMAGTDPVLPDHELEIEFFDDENKWVIVNGECNT